MNAELALPLDDRSKLFFSRSPMARRMLLHGTHWLRCVSIYHYDKAKSECSMMEEAKEKA
jgi:hypothetical protein